ncbi:MAG: YfhO family protein, partial [bacterium]|nr:YfhO family protein [bacterium]
TRNSTDKRHRKGTNLGRVLGAGVGSYLLGLALGAFCLLPNVLAFFGNARSGISTSAISSIPDLSWLLYSKEFYLQLLRGFFFPEYSVQYWCILSFCPAVLLGFFCLFREKKQGRGQGEGFGVWFVLLTVWLLLPCCGYMLNGFSYVSHRWLYAYAFCLSWFLTLGIENMGERKPWELGAYFGLLAVAAGLAYLAGESRRELSGVLLLSLGMGFFLFLSGKDERWLPVGRFGMLLGTGLFCVFSANYLYTAEGLHYTAEFQEAGTALQTMTQVSEAQWKEEMEPDVFYRVEGDTISEANYGMLTGINGTNPFFSIVPETVYRFMHNLENPDSKFPNWYNGMGDRAALMSLASVRYFAMGTNCGSTQVLPFGYEKIAESESGSLYESPYALPLGYTYEAVISEEEMESLEGGIQRQQALMQAAELPKEAIEEIEKEGMEEMDFTILRGEELQLEEQRLDYEIVAMENLTWDRETKAFVVGEGGGSIKLHFEGEAGAETYVRMLNFDTDGSGQELIYYFVGDGESEKKIYLSSNLSVWDGKFKTSLTAVGNGEEVCDRAVIRVPFAGSYHLEEIEVYSLPMQSFCEQAEKLREESLDGNLVGNRVEGNISVSSDKILCLSLPYSGGWSAKVDGKDVSVWKCNGMFLAILVPEGSHRVEFSYRTPGLFWGMGISVLAFLWWIMCHTKYTFAYTKRKRIYE